MNLFGTFERTYMGYVAEDESTYAYLNRTARPEFADARDILERWFAAYPQERQGALASNFKSSNYGPHLGAFFELYCFTLLRVQGFEVHVEQVVDALKDNPVDFVAGPIHSPSLCVESTVIADSEATTKSQ